MKNYESHSLFWSNISLHFDPLIQVFCQLLLCIKADLTWIWKRHQADISLNNKITANAVKRLQSAIYSLSIILNMLRWRRFFFLMKLSSLRGSSQNSCLVLYETEATKALNSMTFAPSGASSTNTSYQLSFLL